MDFKQILNMQLKEKQHFYCHPQTFLTETHQLKFPLLPAIFPQENMVYTQAILVFS